MNHHYLIIAGTQRKDSNTLLLSQFYQKLLHEKGIEAPILNLWELPLSYFDINQKDPAAVQLQNELVVPAKKLIFVTPEYNGSIPGSLKMWMDNCEIKSCFWGKKAALTGISDGRNGNLRGLDHLTGILNYLKINVLHYKVNIPQVSKNYHEDGGITDERLLQSISTQLNEFISF